MDRSPGRPSSGNSSSIPNSALLQSHQNGTEAPSNKSLSGALGAHQEPMNLFGYEASFSMAVLGAIVHIVLALILIFQIKRSKAWYFGLLPQGAVAGIIGSVARIHAILHPGVMTPFVVQKVALSMEPSMVCLAIMFTHTRIIWLVTPNDKRNARVLGVPSNWITCIWGFAIILPDMVKGVVSQLGTPAKGQKPNPHSIYHRVESICGVLQIVAIAAYTIWAANFMRKSASWHPYDAMVKRRNWRLLGWIDVAASVIVTVCKSNLLT
jgi:RTA1 like protein